MVDGLLQVLLGCNRVLISTHIRPDGDAIGSQLALGAYLQRKGKHVMMLNSHAIPDNLGWLPGVDAIQVFDGSLSQCEYIANADVTAVLDCNAAYRLGSKLGSLVRESKSTKVLIDHHTNPETWFDYVYARESAAATGELIYALFHAWDVDEIGPDIATALYVALVTDTGSFRFGTVNSAVHRITADLLDRGSMSPPVVYAAVYEGRSLSWVRLLSRVLGTLTLRFDGQLGYLVVSRAMMAEVGSASGDTEGFVNYAMAIDGVEVSLLFSETPRGTKINFRSRGNYPVHKWAGAFGGGGHRNASGAHVRRPMEEVISGVLDAAPRYLGFSEDAHVDGDQPLTSEDEAYLLTLRNLT